MRTDGLDPVSVHRDRLRLRTDWAVLFYVYLYTYTHGACNTIALLCVVSAWDYVSTFRLAPSSLSALCSRVAVWVSFLVFLSFSFLSLLFPVPPLLDVLWLAVFGRCLLRVGGVSGCRRSFFSFCRLFFLAVLGMLLAASILYG